MLLLEAKNIRKSFGDKTILDIPSVKIYEGDHIGLIGRNGSGKTTLVNILSGKLDADKGNINSYGTMVYISQFGIEHSYLDPKKISEFGIKDKIEQEKISGGERSRLKIAQAFSISHSLLFADEPTSNLDMDGLELFCQNLVLLDTFLIITHDRNILKKYCNRIWELEENQLKEYQGNYNEYLSQKHLHRKSQEREYEKYIMEKKRLEISYSNKMKRANKLSSKPKKTSSSDYKAQKYSSNSRSIDTKSASVAKSAKAIMSRIEHLEKKEKPSKTLPIFFEFSLTDPPENKIIISCENLCFSYGHKIIFNNADFNIINGSKVAICGPNGVGKTTLLDLIYKNELIYKVPKAILGYYRQDLDNLDYEKTVLENALKDSVQKQDVVRNILAHLLFRGTDVNKKAINLSGGERVKLSLAKLILSKANVLLLDEPTNYLDIISLEALQDLFKIYEGTILFVSHDADFVTEVSTHQLIIRNQKIYLGT